MKEEQTTTDKQVWQCRQLAPETIFHFNIFICLNYDRTFGLAFANNSRQFSREIRSFHISQVVATAKNRWWTEGCSTNRLLQHHPWNQTLSQVRRTRAHSGGGTSCRKPTRRCVHFYVVNRIFTTRKMYCIWNKKMPLVCQGNEQGLFTCGFRDRRQCLKVI